ncbi:MotE family protein [Roseovarius sp. MBR-154]
MPRARRRQTRPRARGALVLIAALLVTSALVRLGGGAGQAVARASVEAVADLPEGHEPATCERPQDLQTMLTALQDREARLDEREAALADRMQALRIADGEVTRRLAALEDAEESLRATLEIAETAAEDDLGRLTKVYETMKPKQAAALFEQMDPRFAAGFLARMRPEAAAEIMAGLTPTAAHMFSVVLAGRNADVPSE